MKRRISFCYIVITFLLLLTTINISQAQTDGKMEDMDLYSLLERFHGHTCAGSLMGARLGRAAQKAIEGMGKAGSLKAQYFHHSCPVDGIQVFVGTTYGGRDIEVVDRQEHLLLLTDRLSGNQVEARLTEKAMAQGKATRELGGKAGRLPADSDERKKLEQDVQDIYEWFRTAPEEQIVSIKLRPAAPVAD